MGMNNTITPTKTFNSAREAIYEYLIDAWNAGAEELEKLNDMPLPEAYAYAKSIARQLGDEADLERYVAGWII